MEIDKLVQRLSELQEMCQEAKEALTKVQNHRFFLVIAKDVGEPQVLELESMDQCLERLQQLQRQQLEMPDVPIYVSIFEGVRWQLVTGPIKGLRCADRFVPLPISHGPATEVASSLLAFLSR